MITESLLEEKFNQLVNELENQSRDKRIDFAFEYLGYPACREIVNMGSLALPLIHNIYSGSDKDPFPELSLAYVVRAIVGDEFHVPKRIRGKVKRIRKYTIRWLDDYLN